MATRGSPAIFASIYVYTLNARFFFSRGGDVRASYNPERAFKTPGIYGMPKTVSCVYIYIYKFFFNQKILSFTCSRYEHMQLDGAVGGCCGGSFYNFHILNILHTHIFHHQRIIRLLSYWIRVAIFSVPSCSSSHLPPPSITSPTLSSSLLPIQNPLFISHTMETINAATATIRLARRDRVSNACDPVYKTIKCRHIRHIRPIAAVLCGGWKGGKMEKKNFTGQYSTERVRPRSLADPERVLRFSVRLRRTHRQFM